MDDHQLDQRIRRITRAPFRSRFHLRRAELDYVADRGMDVIRGHAEDFIASRLAPQNPPRDGKQTPWKGHPVFLAQHATATCCRTCLQNSHGIPVGRELTAAEQADVVAVICRWIDVEAESAPPRRLSPPPARERRTLQLTLF